MSLNIKNILAGADEYLKKDELDKALTLYKGIIHVNHRNIDALLGCAKVYHKRGDFTMALNYFYKVLEVDECNAVAKASVEMINGIFNFYNKDMYNP